MAKIKVCETFNVPDAVLDEIARDLITTAVEGGINYWATVSEYRWGGPGLGHSDGRAWKAGDAPYASVTVHEKDAEEGVPVDAAKMREAVVKVLTGEAKPFYTVGYGRLYRDRLTEALREVMKGTAFDRTEYDYDARDADCMMQLAVLGNVVYG